MPGFDKATKPDDASKSAAGKTGAVPNKAVLRFAAKAVLAPADILALERFAGNQAVIRMIEDATSKGAPPPPVDIPILEGVNDGSADLWTGTFKVPIDDNANATTPAAGAYNEVPESPTSGGAAPPDSHYTPYEPSAGAAPPAAGPVYEQLPAEPASPGSASGGGAPDIGPAADGGSQPGFYNRYAMPDAPPSGGDAGGASAAPPDSHYTPYEPAPHYQPLSEASAGAAPPAAGPVYEQLPAEPASPASASGGGAPGAAPASHFYGKYAVSDIPESGEAPDIGPAADGGSQPGFYNRYAMPDAPPSGGDAVGASAAPPDSHYTPYEPAPHYQPLSEASAGAAPPAAGPVYEQLPAEPASAPPASARADAAPTAAAPARAPMVVPPAPPKFARSKARGKDYRTEFVQGSHELIHITAMIRSRGQDVATTMINAFGWKQEDCDKYLTKIKNINTDNPDKPLVANISSEEERHAFELVGGSTLTQGDSSVPYDTADMFSKFSGKGWAIYVMNNDGQFFAGQHKVGLFHHSSLLGGADAAGAGELQVKGGTVTGITNKSGHYLPEAEQMVQVFAEFQSRGVNLSGIAYKHMTKPPAAGAAADGKPKPPGNPLFADIKPWPGGAKAFYDQYKDDPAAAPH